MSATDEFVTWVLSKENSPYVFGAKGTMHPATDLHVPVQCFDCSGLITCGLYHATQGRLDWRNFYNAQKIYDSCKELDSNLQRPCFAFYGAGTNAISHVMLVLPDGRAFGACGGNSDTTSVEIAIRQGARVRFRTSHLYRPDFKGFKQIPL